jgi:CMP-N,N'-diacetyllegionaminic acid synthase
MIIGLLTGRAGSPDQELPYKNIYPILGRPVMLYPYLAARESKLIEDIYISTDGEELKKIARAEKIKIIDRPPETARADSQHDACINHALAYFAAQGITVEILVILMCNVPIQPPGSIDRCIQALLDDPSLDTAVTIREWGDHHPSRAKRMGSDGCLSAILDHDGSRVTTTRQLLGNCCYLDHQVWAFRIRNSRLPEDGQWPWYWMGQKIKGIENTDIVVDLHNRNDVRYAEMWLQAQGVRPHHETAAS